MLKYETFAVIFLFPDQGTSYLNPPCSSPVEKGKSLLISSPLKKLGLNTMIPFCFDAFYFCLLIFAYQ